MIEAALALRAAAGLGLRARASAALDAGFTGVALRDPFCERDWEALADLVPRRAIRAAELFLPLPRPLRSGEPCPFALAPFDPEERRETVRRGGDSILFAEEHEVPTLLAPPQRLEDVRALLEARLPGERARARGEVAVRELRATIGRKALDALKIVLTRLLDIADRRGRRIALVPTGGIAEFPSYDECLECLTVLGGAPLDLWWDASVPLPPGEGSAAGSSSGRRDGSAGRSATGSSHQRDAGLDHRLEVGPGDQQDGRPGDKPAARPGPRPRCEGLLLRGFPRTEGELPPPASSDAGATLRALAGEAPLLLLDPPVGPEGPSLEACRAFVEGLLAPTEEPGRGRFLPFGM